MKKEKTSYSFWFNSHNWLRLSPGYPHNKRSWLSLNQLDQHHSILFWCNIHTDEVPRGNICYRCGLWQRGSLLLLLFAMSINTFMPCSSTKSTLVSFIGYPLNKGENVLSSICGQSYHPYYQGDWRSRVINKLIFNPLKGIKHNLRPLYRF